MNDRQFRAAVVTVSDSASRGDRDDLSGPAAARLLEESGIGVAQRLIIPDELERIKATLVEQCDREEINLVVTSGGTGFSPRDLTPEATLAVVERQANSLAELMRARACGGDPRSALSRGIAGIRAATLIVNLPGSPSAVEENLKILLPILGHALLLLGGGDPH